MITKQDMKFWLEQKYNVLLTGMHGVGKTSLVIEAFEEFGLVKDIDYVYFSSPTIDVWTDFVGIPKEKIDKDGKSYLDFIRPRNITDSLKYIIMDEYNRSSEKTRNATMELLQFKSINGKKFPKMCAIWGMINPNTDDLYQVNDIDPAQRDRYQIQVTFEYEPSISFFQRVYGAAISDVAIGWWNDLKTDELKMLVSPRRLDYALQVHLSGGNLYHVLDKRTNVQKLKTALANVPIVVKLKELHRAQDKDSARKFLMDDNNFTSAHELILKNVSYRNFFIPLYEEEKLVSKMCENSVIKEFVFEHSDNEYFKSIIEEIKKSNTNDSLKKDINKVYGKKIKAKLETNDIKIELMQNMQIFSPQRIVEDDEAIGLTRDEFSKFNRFAIEGDTIKKISCIKFLENSIKLPNNHNPKQSLDYIIAYFNILDKVVKGVEPEIIKRSKEFVPLINYLLSLPDIHFIERMIKSQEFSSLFNYIFQNNGFLYRIKLDTVTKQDLVEEILHKEDLSTLEI